MEVTLKEVSQRFPFTDEELQLLIKCHQLVFYSTNIHPLSDDSFLVKLCRASILDNSDPLTVEEKLAKVRTCEDNILPVGFSDLLLKSLLNVYLIGVHDRKDHLFQFLEGLAECGRRSPRNALKIIFRCCSGGEHMSKPLLLIDLCYRLSIASEYLINPLLNGNSSIPIFDPPAGMVASLTDAMVLSNGKRQPLDSRCNMIDFDAFEIWADINAPFIHATLGTFIHYICFHAASFPLTKQPFNLPKFQKSDSSIFNTEDTSILFEIACMSFNLGKMWNLVYSSERDGACFNRLQRNLLGFSAPTLFLIKPKDSKHNIFGAYTSTPWKESGNFFGDSSSCFLFQIEPHLRIYYPKAAGNINTMYFNSSLRTKGYDGYAHGCGFGGDKGQPRLFISESFEKCFAGSQCQSFDDGPLINEWNEYFDIGILEVWSVGSEMEFHKACEERIEYWKTFHAHANDAKRVDRKQLLEDFESNMASGKLFSHRDQTRGRHEFQVDETHGGYKLDRNDKV